LPLSQKNEKAINTLEKEQQKQHYHGLRKIKACSLALGVAFTRHIHCIPNMTTASTKSTKHSNHGKEHVWRNEIITKGDMSPRRNDKDSRGVKLVRDSRKGIQRFLSGDEKKLYQDGKKG
jgi:hypothetical protein